MVTVPEWLLRSGNATWVGMMVVDGDATKWLWLVLGSFEFVAEDVQDAVALYLRAPLVWLRTTTPLLADTVNRGVWRHTLIGTDSYICNALLRIRFLLCLYRGYLLWYNGILCFILCFFYCVRNLSSAGARELRSTNCH